MEPNRKDESKGSPVVSGPKAKAPPEDKEAGRVGDAGFGFHARSKPRQDGVEGASSSKSKVGTKAESASLTEDSNRKRSASSVRRVNSGSSLQSSLSDSSSKRSSKKVKSLDGAATATAKKETMTRKRYGNQLKHDVLQFLKNTEMNYEQVALKFDVSVSALRDWRKREDQIKRSVEEKRVTMKSNPHYFLKKINDSVMQYYYSNQLGRKNKRPISVIRKKALEVRDRLLSKHQRKPFLDDSEVEAITSFKASSSWAVKLVIRHEETEADGSLDDDGDDDDHDDDDEEEEDEDDNQGADDHQGADLDSVEIKEKLEEMRDFVSKYGHLFAARETGSSNSDNASFSKINISDDLRVLTERVDSLEAKVGAMLQTQQEIMMALRG